MAATGLFPVSWDPIFPRSGFPMKVHDRNDEHNIATKLINDPVRKLLRSAAAGSLRER